MTKAATLKAYAVMENDERTGAIYFAKHAITARRHGANEYADGDISYVTCNRVRWADHCAETGIVPAWLMIHHGWHFECSGCGHRIDSDFLDERDIHYDDVQGHQHSVVFCTPLCEARHNLYRAEAKHRETRWIRRFEKIILRRFPDAKILRDGQYLRSHAYAPKRSDGIWRVEQVIVSFKWPGQDIGTAALRIDTRTEWPRGGGKPVTRRGKPHWTCCSGDREAFEAYAAAWAGKLKAERERA
jgi:hypothetical protein